MKQTNAFKEALQNPNIYLTLEAYDKFRKTYTVKQYNDKFFYKYNKQKNTLTGRRANNKLFRKGRAY